MAIWTENLAYNWLQHAIWLFCCFYIAGSGFWRWTPLTCRELTKGRFTHIRGSWWILESRREGEASESSGPHLSSETENKTSRNMTEINKSETPQSINTELIINRFQSPPSIALNVLPHPCNLHFRLILYTLTQSSLTEPLLMQALSILESLVHDGSDQLDINDAKAVNLQLFSHFAWHSLKSSSIPFPKRRMLNRFFNFHLPDW